MSVFDAKLNIYLFYTAVNFNNDLPEDIIIPSLSVKTVQYISLMIPRSNKGNRGIQGV